MTHAPRDLPVPQVYIEGEGWVMEDEYEDRELFNGDHYILGGRVPILCEDMNAWALWMAAANRVLAATTIGDHRVQTVFRGVDAAVDEGPALLYRTTVSGTAYGSVIDNYSTWADAEKGHKRICEGIATNTLFTHEPGQR